ncbi:MAG: nicotinamide-nucleotide amidase [Solirubrobacteraceae bacterium]|nr:nicotinamide-nucleotide amidase [Solirubrobacteraceae bacterium]
MSARAGIVVTGTEVLTGRVADANGPWLSDRLREAGVDHAYTLVVGDRREDMEQALHFLAGAGMDLILTSGGLGPTADDLTAEVVGAFQGRAMVLDEALEGRIGAIVTRAMRNWPAADPQAMRAGSRKQAIVPEGATVLEPVGTAPGLVVPPASGDGPTVVVLPGPPPELQAMWPAASGAEAFGAATRAATTYLQRTLRLYGIPESEIAETLRVADAETGLDGLEITTCLRRGEIEVVTRYEPASATAYDAFADVVRRSHPGALFSEDGSTVDEQVAALLRERGLTIATAESCTGGLLAGRLTDLPGSSEYVAGGVVAYSNEAKSAMADVPAELIERVGAVSAEVAEALADGARARLRADVGVGVTGIAGPAGGTEAKPVGLVCLSVAGPDGARLTRSATLPGDRADVRARSTTVAMHLVRRLLRGEQDTAAATR